MIAHLPSCKWVLFWWSYFFAAGLSADAGLSGAIGTIHDPASFDREAEDFEFKRLGADVEVDTRSMFVVGEISPVGWEGDELLVGSVALLIIALAIITFKDHHMPG